MTGLIANRFPGASFDVCQGVDDPTDAFIFTSADVDDLDDLLAPVLDRMLTLQLDEGVPVYVVPVRSTEQAR